MPWSLPRSAVAAASLTLCALALMPPAFAAQNFTLTIRDHRFAPETLKVPVGEEFDLTVINSDPTSEEFESNDFHVEKVIAGGKQATFHVGPLEAGTYSFFGERHEETALGKLFAE